MANGANIASVACSIDFDQQCLSFNPADNNSDGLPEEYHLHDPGRLRHQCQLQRCRYRRVSSTSSSPT